MVTKPSKRQRNQKKDDKIYVGRSMSVDDLLFHALTLCIYYIINTFLLVSSSVNSKQQCVLCIVNANNESKNKSQRTLSGFITIPLYFKTNNFLFKSIDTFIAFQNASKFN